MLVNSTFVAYTVGMSQSATSVGRQQVATPIVYPDGHAQWPTLCPVDATPEERQLRAATARRKRLDAQLKAARMEERAAMLAAMDAGLKQVQVVAITGFTREHIRRLAEAARSEANTG